MKDKYEGTEKFNEMVGKRVQHLIELVRNHLEQEQSEVDLEKEMEEHAGNMPHCEFSHYTEDEEDEEWAKKEFRHFYELGLNARKENRLTLEEAIIHCKEKACDNTQCALEHRQLAEWLEELQQYRKNARKEE